MTEPLLLHLTESSPEPLRRQIARQVRSRILSGDLAEGWLLPPVHRVAREHHVSPPEVQRALDELAADGLLEPDADGLRVAPLAAGQRRSLARHRLLDDLREQELSLRELELARDIQRRLLPPGRVETPGATVVSRSFPARFVTGDFHDVLRPADGSLGLVVADVAGKGFAASLVMASVKAMTPFVAAENGVAGTLRELNRRLAAEPGRGRFVALAYARVDAEARTVELASAGMPDPFLVRAGGRVEAVEVHEPRLPLGIRPDTPYTALTFPVEEGDRLLLFSDGIPEARRPGGEPFGYEALAQLLGTRPPGEALEPWLDGLLGEVERATGPVLEDDWTAVALESRRRCAS